MLSLVVVFTAVKTNFLLFLVTIYFFSSLLLRPINSYLLLLQKKRIIR